MKKTLAILTISLLVLLSSCQTAAVAQRTATLTFTLTPYPTNTFTPMPTPSKEDLNDQLENTIASESELWDSLKIQSYQIKVHDRSNWVDYTLILTVNNNKVIAFEASCGEAIIDIDGSFCKQALPNIVPDSYTVQGLFEKLKNSRTHFEADKDVTSSWSDSISITFDPKYHYPKLINFDIPEMADEEYTTEVLVFEILPTK